MNGDPRDPQCDAVLGEVVGLGDEFIGPSVDGLAAGDRDLDHGGSVAPGDGCVEDAIAELVGVDDRQRGGIGFDEASIDEFELRKTEVEIEERVAARTTSPSTSTSTV